MIPCRQELNHMLIQVTYLTRICTRTNHNVDNEAHSDNPNLLQINYSAYLLSILLISKNVSHIGECL